MATGPRSRTNSTIDTRPSTIDRSHGIFLGFDFGLQRIGVAVGQALTGSASPLKTLRCRDAAPDWTAIESLINDWNPEALVVGVPYNMDGTEHALTHAAQRFARRLHGRFGLPVHKVDERLSSVEAEQRLARTRGRARRGKRQKEQIDSVAAQVILETWLSQMDNAGG